MGGERGRGCSVVLIRHRGGGREEEYLCYLKGFGKFE